MELWNEPRSSHKGGVWKFVEPTHSGTPKSAPSASVHLLLLAFSFELRDANANVVTGRGEDNFRMCVAVPIA